MNRRRGGLGSGLDALLPSDVQQGGMREVAIKNIRQNPRQPRTRFDEEALDELAASIREHGIIQPLIVSERDNGQYELVAGERRWRAAQRAGLEQISVIVRETTPQQLLELALIENVQRADLNALEEAHAYQSLWEEFGLSDSQIAKRVGKNSREAIANTRRLLKLPAEVQEAVLKSQISAGHGRALLKFEAEQQRQAFDAILSDDLNVREVEQMGDLTREYNGDISRALTAIRQQRVSRAGDGRRTPARSHKSTSADAPGISPEDQEIRREMERVLGTPVSLARSDKDLRVTIIFHTEEKLQEFFDLLNAR
jgi:ParB family transcriptional regulator, chromosome partitioning protein